MPIIDMSKPVSAPEVLVPEKSPVMGVVISTQVPAQAGGQMTGEFGAKDVAIPYLRIGQPSSKGVIDNPQMIGQFVYAEGSLLGKTVTVVPIRISKHYQQKTEYEDTQIPQRWTRVAEAEASGLPFEEHGVIDMLVEVPADRSGEFEDLAFASVDGKDYLAARMDVKTRGYNNTVGVLLRDLNGWLKGMFKNGKFNMAPDKRTNGQNTWFVPTMKAAGPSSEALREEIKTRFDI